MAVESLRAPLSLRERYAGALYGALCGDALACSETELAGQTHYGNQALGLMDSLTVCGGNFVMEDFARRWRQFAEESKAAHDSATAETLAHLQKGLGLTRAGSASMNLGGACRIVPVLVALRNDDAPVILAAARAQTALTHATPSVIESAELFARTFFLLLRGVSVASALQAATSFHYKTLQAEHYLRLAEDTHHLGTAVAVKELGQSGDLSKALPATLAILLHHGEDPEIALAENITAGGDSAARGMVLGMLLGAAHGRRAIPARWMASLQARAQVEAFLKMAGLGEE